VKHALSTGADVIGFRVGASKAAEGLAKTHNIKIVTSEIVYDLLKMIEESLKSTREKMAIGKLEILATFGKKDGRQIIGGRVQEGKIVNNATLQIERKGEVMDSGRIINLQQAKKDVPEVPSGNECGLLFDSKSEIRVGDILIAR